MPPLPVRHAGLTERQTQFIEWLVRGRSPEQAAKEAGYSDASASASANLANPAVLATLHSRLAIAIQSELVPLAINTARKILNDDAAPASARAAVIKIALDRGGHAAPTGSKDSVPDDATLAEMSAEQLRAFLDRASAEIDRLEAELASRAKAVNAPDNAPDDQTASQRLQELLG